MEVASNWHEKLSGVYISETSIKIGEAALTGMLYEAGTTLKPGLVTPISKGSHRDMDYFKFLRSSAAISNVMCLCAQIGCEYKYASLPEIRRYGMKAEREMLKATDGVNTQKGLLFLGGITSAAAGICIDEGVEFDRVQLSKSIRVITKGLVAEELEKCKISPSMTPGERIYKQYGIRGVRGEIEDGLPTVMKQGLPLFEEGIANALTLDSSLTHCLIAIMSAVEDTVVINRVGIQGLDYVKKQASKAMELGGMLTPEGKSFIIEMGKNFIEKNISPGGAADLLAITVMIYELEKMNLTAPNS